MEEFKSVSKINRIEWEIHKITPFQDLEVRGILRLSHGKFDEGNYIAIAEAHFNGPKSLGENENMLEALI